MVGPEILPAKLSGSSIHQPEGAGLLLDFISGQAVFQNNVASLNDLLVCDRAGSGWTIGADGVVAQFSANQLRRSDRGLLIEESRTNSAVPSAPDANLSTWNKGANATLTTGQPNPLFADASGVLVEFTGNYGHLLGGYGLSSTASTNYCASFILKRGSHDRGIVQIGTSTGADKAQAHYNLSSGLITSTGNAGAGVYSASGIINLGNDIFVVWIAGSIPGTDMRLLLSNDSTGTGTVSILHAQLERGIYPSSPIRTTGAVATRVHDKISFADTAWFEPQDCTLLVEWEQVAPAAGVQNLVRWNKATYHRLRSGSVVLAQVKSAAGADVFSKGPNVAAPAGVHSLVTALAANDMASAWSESIDGAGGIATDISGTPEGGAPTAVLLGSAGSSEALNGWLRKIVYWPERLGDAELLALVP